MNYKNFFSVIVIFHTLTITCFAQEIIKLYPDKTPNSRPSSTKESFFSGMYKNVTEPTLQIYLPDPEKATGMAVVICPGGGYSVVVYEGEGITTAKKFVKEGIAAFVLKYRLPNDSIMIDKKIGPLQDVQQAMKIVRENAIRWKVDTEKIGIMGFSAGGHLAATLATHFEKTLIENDKNTSLRPDFQILVYPVISMMDSLTHPDSRKNLLGENPSNETIIEYSNEMQIDKNTPPAYITHASDDKLVDVSNSIEYYLKLRKNNVDVEMHLFQKGDHGFIFRQKFWMQPLINWMKDSGWIK